jgi:hypothetical protein
MESVLSAAPLVRECFTTAAFLTRSNELSGKVRNRGVRHVVARPFAGITRIRF